jgi:flavin reductase (DIM6/NTAB) family NADH-FMN oxidoreductase RutF/DNA-binding IclR family transcriptional regulator
MDARELRNVFGSFVTGVTVITTVDAEGRDQGVTANSFSSVSLDPPLVLWSQARSARSFAAFQSAGHFIVNILSEHQRDLSQRFASPGQDKFQGLALQRRNGGLPALPGCCAYIECRKVANYPGGDHLVYLGEVLAVERHGLRPLAFARGRYMVAFEHEMNLQIPDGRSAHLAHNDVVRLACAVLPELASCLGATCGVAVWGNRGATIVRWEAAPEGLAPELRTGIVVSPLSSATGLLFSAFLPDELVEPIRREALVEVELGGNPDADSNHPHANQLTAIRTAGVSVVRKTRIGRAGIATPVFDASGRMVLALCAVANNREDETQVDTLVNGLHDAARALSARLGHGRGLAHPPAT